MNREDVLRLVDSIDWDRARWQMGPSSGFVPAAFRQLIDAQTEEEADRAYWMLDNGVVVQGRLYESAEKLVPSLLAALQTPLSAPARHRVVELITEIALGVTSDDETAVGNRELAESCRAAIRLGLPTLYALLADPDPRVRRAVLYTLDRIEPDRAKLAFTTAPLARADPDSEVRELAARYSGEA